MNDAPRVRGLRTSDYDYDLPPELIAQHPAPARDGSRLLVVHRADGTLTDGRFTDFPALVAPGDALCVNSTRVRHARLLAERPSGAPAEVLLLRPLEGDRWLAMGRPGSALQPGKRVTLGPGAEVETLLVRDDGTRVVRFVGLDASAAIACYGRVPLPPYITRDPDAGDDDRYQTVFADRVGSVAAPTAGLHFTVSLLERLEERGVPVLALDLQVGPGTFKPVDVEDPGAHPMHAEHAVIPGDTADAIAAVRARGGALWAVGTTVVRALESRARPDGTVEPGAFETSLLITPGHRFRAVDRLLTNFHLPRSTLLMLVAAFAGYDLAMAAYAHAVRERYRFYSYGDAMVII